MKTLTIHEASSDLATWLERALAGEDIRIRAGDAVVALRPEGTPAAAAAAQRSLSPREALQCLQRDARLTAGEAGKYLDELREERLANDQRRPA